MAEKLIQLEIVTSDRQLVSEEVESVTIPGSLGEFQVFYGHTPLLTALDIGHVVYDKGGKRTVVCISGGFCEVAPDHILILARTAETLEMIDRARAEAARNRAQKRLEEKGAVSIDEERARLALLRALNRLGAVDMI
jgi:F-type H+-transporting ATPase subunit epsilon